MSYHFPTFMRFAERLRLAAVRLPKWLSTPWWPADTLAAKQRALLSVLAVATSERLELAPLIAVLADEHRGRYRRRLSRLSKRLTAGSQLPDALEQTPGVLSDEQLLTIRFGIQSGTLNESLHSLVKQEEPTSHHINHRLSQIGFYAMGIGIVFVMVLSFIMISIMPSFQKIFDDFGLSLGEPTNLLIRISETVVNYGVLIVLGLLLVLWLFKSEISRRFFRRQVLSRLLRPVGQLRSADLLQLLAIAQQAGRPLTGALSTLARYHYDSKLRQQLLLVRNEVEQGAELWNSMVASRLILPAEARALSSAAPTNSLEWTMLHLAKWRRKRVARRFDIYIDVLQPIVVLLMAAVVLFTALGTLLPLFDLVNSLAG